MKSYYEHKLSNLLKASAKSSTKIELVASDKLTKWCSGKSENIKNRFAATDFKARSGQVCVLSNAKGKIEKVFVGYDEKQYFNSFGGLSTKLPVGVYEFANLPKDPKQAVLTWVLGAYQFTYFKDAKRKPATLVLPKGVKLKEIETIARPIFWGRDLVNLPTNKLNTKELAAQAKLLAKEFNAKCKEIAGENLLKENFPLIYNVGKASSSPPRLIDITWGNAKHKKITLVGKGITFDTGGLDLKSAAGMATMKKDMGGSAHVLCLARMIMMAKLPIRLRVLVSIAENSVSSNAMRPSDIIKSRKGLTVDIGNTDAEGRLVLADALTEAASEKPELVIDFATLTGACRVALGTDLPAMFTADEKLAQTIRKKGIEQEDQVWHMPLHNDYFDMIDSEIADVSNCAAGGYGGGITAALFLQEFVGKKQKWMHFDLMAANVNTKPGRPKGGEMQGVRAVFEYLKGL